MTWELALALGAITYLSRALAVAFLPSLPERVRGVIDRMPAALFAGVAVHSLLEPGASWWMRRR